MKVKLSELTLKEVRERMPVEVAVLPWGACEPHNLHLPYGIDTITAERVAELSAQKACAAGARVVVLPVLGAGCNANTLGFPLTLDLAPTTQLAILQDVIRSLENHKVHKLVILNGHGGNEFKLLLRQLHGRSPVHTLLVDWWTVRPGIWAEVCTDAGGEHANEAETAWALYLCPDLVHLEWADAGQVRTARIAGIEQGWVKLVRPWHALTTNAGYGNAAHATADKGRRIVEPITDDIAAFLKEFSDARLDSTFPY